MNTYLKKFASFILKSELEVLTVEVEESRKKIEALSREKEKLEKKAKFLETPKDILLKYYRIDNIGDDGLPPSYLKTEDPNEYGKQISELANVYRNTTFREMMAWSLNFHANMSFVGKLKNEFGDEIDVPSERSRDMIDGIKAIWELVVAAYKKDSKVRANKNFDPLELDEELDLE